MMNLSQNHDHNILGLPSSRSIELVRGTIASNERRESGYTLVALLAMMTVLAIFAMAAAPGIHQQVKREKEKEAIFRGEQVANAIRQYYRYRISMRMAGDQALPSSMDQLIQGVPIQGGSKTRQILRPSASRDPLTLEGEWRQIRPRSDALIDFQQAVMLYAGSMIPPPRDQQMLALQQFAVPQITNLLNTGTSTRSTPGSSLSEDSSGPFVGVASRSTQSSVLTFYGIETHDGWIFTPLFRP